MDCCSSNYMDYRHSINNNFCYPYSPGMVRSASPYPMGFGTGPPGAGRYGSSDFRSSYYDSFDKYGGYGSYHHGPGHGYGSSSNYYGSYSSYRNFAYNDFYHGPPSSGSHHFSPYGPSHMFNRQSLPFQRDSFYHHRAAALSEHPHQHQYPNFSTNYPLKPTESESGSSNPLTNASVTQQSPQQGTGSNSPSSHFNSQHEQSSSEYGQSPDYSAQSFSPSHHSGHSPGPGRENGGGSRDKNFSSAMSNATGGGFPLSIKEARLQKLKERKLAKCIGRRNGSPNGNHNGGQNQSGESTCSSPNPHGGAAAAAAGHGSHHPAGGDSSPHGNVPGDALSHERYDRENHNDSPSRRHGSPAGRRATGASPPKRPKKQTLRNRRSATALEPQDHRQQPPLGDTGSSAMVPERNVTPLPGFQQAFGSTEIGKFSEAFFNSSPGPAADRDGLSMLHSHHHHHHALAMNSPFVPEESDVETMPSPASTWDPYDGSPIGAAQTAFNLQIGTSFHPSYYESSSYSSDPAVDSPLGSYFSEMTCNEFVN
ncbi:filaggrin-2-like [Uranotaenia lowii]|uniref:filaggrin-2-like n=1 Tax=Uranotaenia lowii TaxID=190385 RepID=UPI0024792EB5|nr:filaggrin-2-like [Uranotaenia lowii]